MPAQPTPPRISGYDFIQPLGTGATASVYRYHQRVPSRDVAIKVSSATLDPRAAARFRNEANYMAELSAHPYILSIHDAGVTSTGLGYIVLEYAPGGSYKELIRKRPLTADQMLDLGIKLCSALFTAHCKGILHRDIKPANILRPMPTSSCRCSPISASPRTCIRREPRPVSPCHGPRRKC